MPRKPRRAANGQALPYQRASDGRWCVTVTTGYNPATGKPIRKTLYGATSAVVADALGHSLQVLMQTYAHKLAGRQNMAAIAMDAAMGEKQGDGQG